MTEAAAAGGGPAAAAAGGGNRSPALRGRARNRNRCRSRSPCHVHLAPRKGAVVLWTVSKMYQAKKANQSTRDMMANQEKNKNNQEKNTATIYEEGNPTCTES